MAVVVLCAAQLSLSSPLIGTAGCLKSAALGTAYLLGTLETLGTSLLVLSYDIPSHIIKWEMGVEKYLNDTF